MEKINSKTRILGLFGNPVEHSISPLFMNYIFEKLNLNYRYFAFKVESEKLKDAVNAIRALYLKGINVTIPYKEKIFNFIDDVSIEAKNIGAINCISNEERGLVGYNTDYLGFILPLIKRREDKSPKNIRDFKVKDMDLGIRSMLLLGCGGAARAVIYAVKKIGVKRVYLVNRTPERAQEFIGWSKSSLNLPVVYAGKPTDVSQGLINKVDMVVNTTPVGMYPDTDKFPLNRLINFRKGMIVYDLIYNPLKTELLKRAETNGALAINGLEMLVSQGIFSLVHWFADLEDKLYELFGDVLEFVKGIV